MRRLPTLALIATLVLTGCVRRTVAEPEVPAPEGPPEIAYDVVRRHAIQFDVDIPSRPPGSQHELAAASYILGHLQLSGYSPRLDRVPVEDAVNSTNVVAMPPGGVEPTYVVTIAYDTGDGARQSGTGIGLFLELARALAVADPGHQVAFVALGAESLFQRGSRRLAQFLVDEGLAPSVITIRDVTTNPSGLYTAGSCATSDGTAMLGNRLGECRGPVLGDDVFTTAEMPRTIIEGDLRSVGAELFGFFTGSES